MKTGALTDAEIRARGREALVEKLGLWGAARLAMQTERGNGDYSAQRHALLGRLTVDELLTDMKASRPKKSR